VLDTGKDKGNAADGRFSTACKDSTSEPRQITRFDLSQCKNRLFEISLVLILGKQIPFPIAKRKRKNEFNIDAQSLGFLLARKNGARR
jgi:hypothetical protein